MAEHKIEYTKCARCNQSHPVTAMFKAKEKLLNGSKSKENVLVCGECSELDFLYEITDAERKRVTKRLSKLFYESVKRNHNHG